MGAKFVTHSAVKIKMEDILKPCTEKMNKHWNKANYMRTFTHHTILEKTKEDMTNGRHRTQEGYVKFIQTFCSELQWEKTTEMYKT
jgi:hypothetical protein